MENMCTVLLVDDDQGARTTLSIALKMAGFEVDTAPDAIEALRKADEKTYTWIVSDVRMPDMDGMQLVRRIRSLQPTSRAILISAFEPPQEMKEVEAFFEKPVDVGALTSVMSRPSSLIQVLGVVGSPRKGGNTDLLLEQVLAGAASTGAEVNRIVIRELNIAPCRACEACSRRGICVIQDDMQQVYPKLIAADRLAFASPIYFLGVSAQAKAFIDRTQCLWARQYVLRQPLVEADKATQRKGLFISVGGTKGKRLFEGAIRTVRSFFDAIQMQYVGELVFWSVDERGAIRKHPTALQQAFDMGVKLCESHLKANEISKELRCLRS